MFKKHTGMAVFWLFGLLDSMLNNNNLCKYRSLRLNE